VSNSQKKKKGNIYGRWRDTFMTRIERKQAASDPSLSEDQEVKLA
jgi:hypothetical protein